MMPWAPVSRGDPLDGRGVRRRRRRGRRARQVPHEGQAEARRAAGDGDAEAVESGS